MGDKLSLFITVSSFGERLRYEIPLRRRLSLSVGVLFLHKKIVEFLVELSPVFIHRFSFYFYLIEPPFPEFSPPVDGALYSLIYYKSGVFKGVNRI